jgi:hypothetical protein
VVWPSISLGRLLNGSALNFSKSSIPGRAQLWKGVTIDAWDVSFLGIDPATSAEADFSSAYVEAVLSYLVPANSFIHSIADEDRPGVRIGVQRRDLVDILLSRMLNQTSLFGLTWSPTVFNFLRPDKPTAPQPA